MAYRLLAKVLLSMQVTYAVWRFYMSGRNVDCGMRSGGPTAARNRSRKSATTEHRTTDSSVVPQSPAVTAALPTANAKAALAPAELDYLPEDAFAIVQFNSRRAFQSKALSALPFDELFGGSLEIWSFDPRDVDRWLVFFTPPVEDEPLGTPYSPGAVMRFAEPIDARKLIETRGAVREAQLGGRPCLIQTAEHPLAFYVANERTIAFGAVKQLEKMLTPTHVKNPLAGRIAQAGNSFDLDVLLNIEPLTPALDAVSQAAQSQLPPAALPYVKGAA